MVSAAAGPDAATAELLAGPVDCLVCGRPIGDERVGDFLRFVREAAPDVPIVLAAEAPGAARDVAPGLYDEWVPATDDRRADERSLVEAVERCLDRRAGTGSADPSSGASTDRAVEATGDAVLRLDADGAISAANARMAAHLGVPREEALGRALCDVLDADRGCERWLEAVDAAVEEGRPVELRESIDGRVYLLLVVPLDDGGAQILRRDVTERVETRRALERERAFIDGVLDNLTDIFFVMNTDAEFVRWNERVGAVTGYGADEIAAMSPFDLMAAEDVSRAAAAVSRIVEDGEATEEIRIETRDGERIPYEFTGSLVRDSAGDPLYICGIGRDVTERKRHEEQLRRKREELDRKNAELDRKNAELERSNAELERFASVASHDLKEPLRVVSSYLELLERRYGEDLDTDAREFVAYAVEGADRMREMIENLLHYSRVSRRDESRAPVDCEVVVKTVLENMQVTVRRADAEVAVDELPTVVGMETLLVQLFQNLIGNAIAYAGDAPPRVRIGAERRGDEWLFAVADNGVGIPPERHDRIFDLFSGSGTDGGTGIGLATCERIVERHGGDIWVESEPGEGSTFYFTLPAASAASGPLADPTAGERE
ncbi:sensor histidine kinase [Halegenticoccus soli]|uniref:sensor histidine kinase n=1 Tax=Halegenticoccus soli TaxID=1985678 RepID=UPI0013043711|nr:ATP-binding protein [Halegenticoccus soli]